MFVRKKFSLFGGVAAALLIAYVAVLPAATAFAQATAPVRPPLNLMTSPLPLNVVTTPGKPVTADIRVKNNGGQPETLKIELMKFGADDDTGRPKLLEREPADRYFDWVSFSETSFNAEPNVWKTIKMSVNPPKEAAFGYYYAVVFSRANPERPTGGASGVEGGVASLVLVNVDTPGARRNAEVAELVASQKVYEFLPAQFSVRLRNKGNVHVSPVGTMFIKRGNSQVATLGFNQELGNILPGTNRSFELNWQEGFPAYVTKGTGENATRELKWDFSKIQNLRFGRYTATLVAVYDDGKQDIPIEAEVSFWVIPWRILGVIFLIVLLVGGGMWAIFRQIWRGVRKQIIKLPAVAPAAKPTTTSEEPTAPETPVETLPPLEDEEPEENSLAAHLRRKKQKKQDKKDRKRAQSVAAEAAPQVEVAMQPEPAPSVPAPIKPAVATAPVAAQSAAPLSKKQLKKQKQAAAEASRQESQRKANEEAARKAAEAAEREAKRQAQEAARRAAEEAEREARHQAAVEAARKAEEARIAAVAAAAEAARLAQQAAEAAAPPKTNKTQVAKPQAVPVASPQPSGSQSGATQPKSPHMGQAQPNKKKPKKNKHQNRNHRGRQS